jgi:hypothetical protein
MPTTDSGVDLASAPVFTPSNDILFIPVNLPNGNPHYVIELELLIMGNCTIDGVGYSNSSAILTMNGDKNSINSYSLT